MAKRRKVNKVEMGAVFAIKLDEKRFVYGQVVTDGILKAYIIFDYCSEIHPPIDEIIERQIMFFTHVVDIALEEGTWILLGKTMITHNLKFPFYIVDTPKDYMVTEHDGTIIRRATKEEKERLLFQHSFTPAAIEDAIKAKYGLSEWLKYYDKLLYCD